MTRGRAGMIGDDSFEARYLSGATVYGDDFDTEAIAEWYKAEEHAYYHLSADGYTYKYHALNLRHAFARIRGQRFEHCLALGCAAGDDVAPLAPQITRFTAVEPAEKWWRNTINGTHAEYVKPQPSGRFSLAANTVDLTVCLGVLHHIPNVSTVVAEIARVMRPGSLFILREPICSMGNWRYPRRGLTPCERGLPLSWLRGTLQRVGFQVIRESLCVFPVIPLIATRFGVTAPYNSRILVACDAALSSMLRWNLTYDRVRLHQKLAPSAVFYISRRTGY